MHRPAPSDPSPAAARPRPPLARRVLRTLAWGAATVVGLVVVGAAALYGLSERRMRATVVVPEHPLAVATDPATIRRGARLATRDGCTDCHGPGLVGRIIVDEPAVGRIAGPNLTLGGRGAALADRDWERAVRHGVRPDGRPLLFMPAHEFTGLADDELAAIVAYARSLPPSDAATPAVRVGPVGRALFLAEQLALVPAERVDHERPHPARVAPAPTAAYGRTLAAGCMGCHGATYAGGRIPGGPPDWPAAANLTPTGLGRWTAADFTRALREGRRPDGTAIDPVMPVTATRVMTDVEIAALWAFLRTLPPRPTGAR